MRLLVITIICCIEVFSQVTRSGYSDTLGTNPDDVLNSDSLFIIAAEKLSFLDYNDCNNCPLRAHVIAFVFSKRFPGIKIAKVWLFADSKLSSRHDYYKTHRKEFLTGIESCSQWGFHVAPVIISGNDTIIIDPSTQSSPAGISDWIDKISGGEPCFVIFKNTRYYSYPDDEHELFDDKQSVWDTAKLFTTAEAEINFLADKLTGAYSKVFDPVKFSYYKNKITSTVNKNDR